MQRGIVLQAIRKVLPHGSLLLALLITILAGRFTFVALEPWTGLSEEPKKGPRKSRRAAMAGPSVSATSEKARLPASSTPKTAAGQTTIRERVMIGTVLSVKHGTQRSGVYVDGELVGNTPFAGDLSCRRGEPVTIEIVPRKGPAIVRTPVCHSGAIEVFE